VNVLVTGATGYIGGRLIPLLLAEGHEVRVLVRDPTRLKARPWEEQVEILRGDVTSGQAVTEAAGSFRTSNPLDIRRPYPAPSEWWRDKTFKPDGVTPWAVARPFASRTAKAS
jgi:NAD(P)-dependent dehydrogenase (short-subunit alcohol dehydrogenase family)